MNLVRRLRFLYRAWNYRYRVEPSEVAFLLKSLRPGQTAIDIGAHKGAFTYWMRQRVGAAGRIYAFEPQPELANYLSWAMRSMSYANVTIVQAGVSQTAGTMELSRPTAKPSPGATLHCDRRQHTDRLEVDVYSLDEFFCSHPARPVSFIKCDVEGHELEVFQGASHLLQEDRPVLMFECEKRHHRSQRTSHVFQFLRDIGYVGQCFYQGTTLPLDLSLLEAHQDPQEDGYINNFCFMPSRRAA